MDFLTLRKSTIKKYFGRMNDRQFEAVTTIDGPLLILAGAGSGKTTVLVNRILNLVRFGDAYNSDFISESDKQQLNYAEDYLNGKIDSLPDNIFSVKPVNPWNILAITFTNKAAGELKDRIASKLGDKAQDIWAGTFHSICGKILRRYADLIGYTSHFTIYDTDDQRRIMKEIMKQNNIDEKLFPPKSILSAISKAKDKLITPSKYMQSTGFDFKRQTIGQIYEIYQKKLKQSDAMDFDDMIVNTVKLLEKNDEVLKYYSDKFKYIMVDEYQDTNHAQYSLVSLLAEENGNLCVVGDDDQSIYRFRGATIENILNFEKEYKNSKVIRLEQNYRSTSNILNAANAVIKNNNGRKGKTLWTSSGDGSKIEIYTANDEREEAKYVAEKILENVNNGCKFSDNAILYRMNAQSNALESVFARSGIAYKVVGGTKFYDRKEIKDIISYLQLINNNSDNLRLKRVINEPRRGIGDTTVNYAANISAELGISILDVIREADQYSSLSRSSAKLKAFSTLIDDLTELSLNVSISDLFEEILVKTGYRDSLISAGEEEQDRLQNVEEFASTIAQYEADTIEPSLSGFLEEIALVSDIDMADMSTDRAVLMTIHSAKGLEFDNVYIIGMEEGIFPGNQSIYAGPEEIEEERRLAYVAITRAKKQLYITNAYTRLMFGTTSRNSPSRFLTEIPDEVSNVTGVTRYSAYESSSYDRNKGWDNNTGYNYSASKRSPVKSPVNSVHTMQSSLNRSKISNNDNQKYIIGQRVKHKTFGEGMIVSAVSVGGNDTMLEILFDNVGSKKLMANYAKLIIL